MLSQYMEQNGEITDEVLANLLSADHLLAKQSDFKDNLLAVGRRRRAQKSLTARSANYLCICSFSWEMCSMLKSSSARSCSSVRLLRSRQPLGI